MVLALGLVMADETVTVLAEDRSVSPTTREVTFTCPPFSVEHQVRLSLEARIDWPHLAGSNPWLKVAVNDTPLTARHLLNKTNEFKLRRGLDLTWYKDTAWRILYSPDFEVALRDRDNPNAAADADPYHFVWDITALVHPGPNTLRLTNLKVLERPETTMVIRHVTVTVGRPISPPAAEAVRPAPTGPLPTYVAATPAPPPMSVRLEDGWRLVVGVGGRELTVVTRTSLPAGAWHTAPGTAATSREGVLTAAWANERYRVDRRVEPRPDHLHIADTLTNLTGELLGVIVEHRLTGLTGKVRLAGEETIGDQGRQHSAYHPSAIVEAPDLAVGLFAENDLFRVHNLSFRDGAAAGIRDPNLGLPAHESATLEWELYPQPRGDYWSVINAVRRVWGANFAIPGPFVYAPHRFREDLPAETLAAWARGRDLKYVCGDIATYRDGKYAHGTGILFAPEWVAAAARWTQRLMAAAPEVKALAYFHAQCSTEPDGETKYADSRLLDLSGQHLGYPYSYRLPLYLPTRENSYGKALWRFLDTLIDQVGVGGIYWDEMSHSVLWYSTSEPWDQRTVEIDERTHTIGRKLTCVPLAMQPLQLEMVHAIKRRGLFLMGNTPPPTRSMLQEHLPRFVECGTYSALTGNHLGSPIGLGNHHPEDSPAASAEQVRRMLDYAGVYYGHQFDYAPPAWRFTSVMYPLTPVELHEGMVLGAERILTNRSGRYGWPDGAAAEVYVVDAQGCRVAQPDVKEVVEGGLRRYDVRMPSDQFAVIVRR